MKKATWLTRSAAAVAFTITTGATARADCLSDLVADTQSLARQLQKHFDGTTFGKVGNIGIDIGCARLSPELEDIKTCLNTLKEADINYGGLDDARWEELREQYLELKSSGTCDGETRKEPVRKNPEALLIPT